MARLDDTEELSGGGFGRLNSGIDTEGVGDFAAGDAPSPDGARPGALGVGGGGQPTLYGDLSRPITTASEYDALHGRPAADLTTARDLALVQVPPPVIGPASADPALAPTDTAPVQPTPPGTTTTPTPSTPTDPGTTPTPPITPTTPTMPVDPPVAPPVTPTPTDPGTTDPGSTPPTNHVPTISLTADYVVEGQTARTIAHGTVSDADGNTVSVTPTGALAGLVDVVWTGASTFRLDLKAGTSLTAAHKAVSIGVTAADGQGGTATASAAADVNALPVLGAATLTIRGDAASGATVGVVPYTDDGAGKTITEVADPSGLFVTQPDGTIKTSRALTIADVGTYSYTVRGDDGDGGIADRNYSIQVTTPPSLATVSGMSATTVVTLDTSNIHNPFVSVVVGHPDAAATVTATVRITDAGGTVDASLGSLVIPGGTTYATPSAGTYVFSGTAAQVQAALRSITDYNPADGAGSGTARSLLSVTVTDGGTSPASAPLAVDALAAGGTAGDDAITLGANISGGAFALGGGTADTINLAAGTNTINTDSTLGTAATAVLSGVETVNGTGNDDTLTVNGSSHGGTGTWTSRSNWSLYQQTTMIRFDLGGGTNDTLILQSGDHAALVENIETLRNTGSGYVRWFLGSSYNGGIAHVTSGTSGSGDSVDVTFITGAVHLDISGPMGAIGTSGATAGNVSRDIWLDNAVNGGMTIGLANGTAPNTVHIQGGVERFGSIQFVGQVISESNSDDDLTITNNAGSSNYNWGYTVYDLGTGNDTMRVGGNTIYMVKNVENIAAVAGDNANQNVVVDTAPCPSMTIDMGNGTDAVDILPGGPISLALSNVEFLQYDRRVSSGYQSVQMTLTAPVSNLALGNFGSGSDELDLAAAGTYQFKSGGGIEVFRATVAGVTVDMDLSVGFGTTTQFFLNGGGIRIHQSNTGRLMDFDATAGTRIDLSGMLSSGQIDSSHIRIVSETGNSDILDVQVDRGSGWETATVLDHARTGSVDPNAVVAMDAAALDALRDDLIAQGALYASA